MNDIDQEKARVLMRSALEAAKPQLLDLVSTAKDTFIASFGNWVQSAHRSRLEELFVTAGQAKIAVLMAVSEAGAREQQDIFETTIASIETLGLAVWITAKAEAVAALKATINQILSTIAVAAGIVLKMAVEAFVPGVGVVIGPIVGAGVTFALNSAFGTSA